MEYTGIVREGVIVLDGEKKPDEGTRVSVFIPDPLPEPTGNSEQSLGDFLLSFAGICKGGPVDGAAQHDHYIYGTPKKIFSGD